MNRMTRRPVRLASDFQVDAEGELTDSPAWLLAVWAVLLTLTALEALDEFGWIGGPAVVYQRGIHDFVLAAATVLIFVRAAIEPVARRAWLSFAAAMALWCAGTIAWSVAYGGEANPPYPTFADALWLLWYPFMAAGMVFLIRVRFRTFEIHRWLDGIAVMMIVLVAGFGLVVQPLADQSTHSWLATVVDFAYPVLDVLLIGTLLGIYGLLGWRPDAMWIFVGLGIAASACADAAFAVEQARGVAESGHYDFVWTLGALFIAFAAWVRAPTVHDEGRHVTGLRAIALALIAQALAIAIQIVAVFKEIGKSERVVTALVLVVASIQIILTRPRANSGKDAVVSAQAVDRTSSGDGPGRVPPCDS
jgi:diguanylate cyclase